MLKFTLKHYETGSAIIRYDDKRQMAQLTYTRRIHKFEAKADYDRLVTELKTYGDKEALEEFNRIKIKQEQDGRLQAQRDYDRAVQLEVAYDIIGRLDDGVQTVWIEKAIEKLEKLKHVRENIPF